MKLSFVSALKLRRNLEIFFCVVYAYESVPHCFLCEAMRRCSIICISAGGSSPRKFISKPATMASAWRSHWNFLRSDSGNLCNPGFLRMRSASTTPPRAGLFSTSTRLATNCSAATLFFPNGAGISSLVCTVSTSPSTIPLRVRLISLGLVSALIAASLPSRRIRMYIIAPRLPCPNRLANSIFLDEPSRYLARIEERSPSRNSSSSFRFPRNSGFWSIIIL